MFKKLVTVMMASLLFLAGCSSAPATDDSANEQSGDTPAVKVGFIYSGPIGDEGYIYAHDLGRQAVEQELNVETVYIESVAENADCEKAIRDLIDQGCNVIVSTSFGYMDYTLKMAKEFPEIKFLHASGYSMADNMTNYFGRMYEARYVTGVAAGLNTTSNKIGYVAAMPIPEVVRHINAFTLGVKSVNPEATVEVIWTNTWYDPSLEKTAAIELINKDCDVMAQHQNSTAVQLAAEEKGVKCIGFNSATPNVAPNSYLTAAVWNFAPYYVSQVQKVIDGTWTAESYWGHMSEGIVDVDTVTANATEGTAEAVKAAYDGVVSGEIDIFAGEIKDNKGEVKVEAGKSMTDEELQSFDWFVDGVIGSIG